MKNIIKIEEVEYIRKSKYDLLEKKKGTNQKELNKKLLLKFQKDYTILDPANVCGIFPLIEREDSDLQDEIKTEMGLFKLIKNPKMSEEVSFKEVIEAITIEGTRYSKDYFNQIREIGKVWYGEPETYMMYDKKKKKFEKDAPIMFIFGNKLCFVLAPRVEAD